MKKFFSGVGCFFLKWGLLLLIRGMLHVRIIEKAVYGPHKEMEFTNVKTTLNN